MTPAVLLDGLNEGQLAAVTAPSNKHYLVLAGAGCGKTTVLTRRIAFLASGGIPLKSVLALTFTRKAAQEMSGRLLQLSAMHYQEERPTVTTFHAFALSILREVIDGVSNFSRLGFAQIPQLATEKERLSLLAQVSTAAERNQLGRDLLQLDAAIEKLTVFPPSGVSADDQETSLLSAVADRLKVQKREMSRWDFSDLVDGANLLFSKFKEILEYYRRRFSVIMVDEFQDTNPQQIRLLRQLLGDDHLLYAVGDDDQAIYAFRGADIRPTLEFTACFPGAEILKLQTNYRSTSAILQKANRVFAKKDPAYRKILISGINHGPRGSPPSVYRFPDQSEMAMWTLSKVKSLQKREQIPANDMAVLFRLNQSAVWFENWMDEKCVPATDRPQLLTVHKSKGLEFPVVICADLEESLFPSYRPKKSHGVHSVKDFFRIIGAIGKKAEGDLQEELRLFYVAITRAQRFLFLVTVKKRVFYGRTREFRPSRFLRYMR